MYRVVVFYSRLCIVLIRFDLIRIGLFPLLLIHSISSRFMQVGLGWWWCFCCSCYYAEGKHISNLYPCGVTSHQLRLSYEMKVVVLRMSASVSDTYQRSLRATCERE